MSKDKEEAEQKASSENGTNVPEPKVKSLTSIGINLALNPEDSKNRAQGSLDPSVAINKLQENDGVRVLKARLFSTSVAPRSQLSQPAQSETCRPGEKPTPPVKTEGKGDK